MDSVESTVPNEIPVGNAMSVEESKRWIDELKSFVATDFDGARLKGTNTLIVPNLEPRGARHFTKGHSECIVMWWIVSPGQYERCVDNGNIHRFGPTAWEEEKSFQEGKNLHTSGIETNPSA